MSTPVQSQSAVTLLLQQSTKPRFKSGSTALDALITPQPFRSDEQEDDQDEEPTRNDGLRQDGALLEIMGPPGIGKTRMCMSYALNARFQAVDQDIDLEVLVIDSQGSLTPQLICETAKLVETHNGYQDNLSQEVLSGIHYRRIYETSLFVAFLNTLPAWLEQHPLVKLVVIDTLTANLRLTTLDWSVKGMLIKLVNTTFARVLRSLNVSIIVTNQMSMKLSGFAGAQATHPDNDALLVPTLPEGWWEGLNPTRMVLYYDYDGSRKAHMMMAPSPTKLESASFLMDALGPCDHPAPSTIEKHEVPGANVPS
ncbi:P-loop containing nucleoside triphosphate hydrolase protein [Meredithblackwellia eburnea MCA 4105]